VSRLRRLGLAGQVLVTCGAALLAVVAAIWLAGSGGGPASGPRAAGGPLAGNFSLPQLGHPGRTVSLAGYAGKPVIVNFFASWCVPCQQETPELARFYRQAGGRTAIVGVDANDQAARALPFVRTAGVGYPVGVDVRGTGAASAFGVFALPQTFFLDARHRIVKRVYGAVTASELRQGAALMSGAAAASSPSAG
jgi:cytochrome c biogenesis protein CcmG/thiol:disulfide interchange protein DsbE